MLYNPPGRLKVSIKLRGEVFAKVVSFLKSCFLFASKYILLNLVCNRFTQDLSNNRITYL